VAADYETYQIGSPLQREIVPAREFFDKPLEREARPSECTLDPHRHVIEDVLRQMLRQIAVEKMCVDT